MRWRQTNAIHQCRQPTGCSDLAEMSKKELRLMRNEIMARHGYSFNSNDLKKHFESQLWYFPLFTDEGNQLSNIENVNVKFIQEHEK